MVDTVTVAVNDTITQIIKNKKGVSPVQMHAWIQRVLELNPHIGDPDRIYPNERLLIPATVHEPVSDVTIWQNALRHMPPQLGFRPPMHYEIPVETIMPGDTVEQLARQAFADSRYCTVPDTVKRAVFVHNNPRLYKKCIWGVPLPAGTLANMTPFMLPEHEVIQWEARHPIFKVEYTNLRPEVQDLYVALGPRLTNEVGQAVLTAKTQGAAVGLDDALSAMASGYAASGSMIMGQAGALMQEVTEDAVQKFGRGVVCSNKAENLRRVERFLKNHPKFPQLMRQLKEMPRHLIYEANVAEAIATTKSPYANARLMRQQVFMPTLKPSGTRYMGTIKSALNSGGRVIRVASKGMVVVPIVMGVCDVVQAPRERRMRTLFEEGFGALGGFAGSEIGAALGGAIAFSVLGLGPFGVFIAIFICASLVGLGAYSLFKRAGGIAYEASATGNSRLYHSIGELVEAW